MYYIQEADKPSLISKYLNCAKIKNDTIILPISSDFISQKKSQKLALKTKKIINDSNCNKVVVSKKIEKQELFLDYLNTYGIDIVDGKWLFEVLAYDVIDYIIEKKKMNKSDIFIALMANQATENVIYLLMKIVKEYKMINVVTNHISLFKNLENQIMHDYGIMITVTNNKKKSLLKSHVIINFDFPNELINKYSVNEDAIIVNFQGNVKIQSKRFNGVNVNNYEIKILNGEYFDYEKSQKYCSKYLYEAELNKRQPVDEIVKKIRRDNVKIEVLNGINNNM